MTRQQKESKIFDLKPELTLAMKLAATFAITYHGLCFLMWATALVMYHYSLDSYYMGYDNDAESQSQGLITLIVALVLSGLLVFSLIQIFRKKVHGKALFVGFSILLIAFQLYTAGVHPWLRYALEVLMVLIIAPVRMKKRVRIRKGKITLEDSETTPEQQVKEPESESDPGTVQEPQDSETPASSNEPLS